MAKLSVNVNKIATLRNARGQNQPNLVQVSEDIIQYGAFGITVHPRPDERHIKKQDAYDLAQLIKKYKKQLPFLEYNVEGYPSEDFLQMVVEIRPDQCTLVPDPPDVLTSNAGWDLVAKKSQLQKVLKKLKTAGVRSSVFMDPADNNDDQFNALAELKPDRIELYTEAFAKAYGSDSLSEVLPAYQLLALKATEAGVALNAGHDLNLENLKCLTEAIPAIQEVSIGHALICESLYLGLETTVKKYLQILES